MNVVTPFEGIGASVRRKEDLRFLSGRGQYTDDLNRPGQGYAHILRSPHPHARIRGTARRTPAG
jgi:carbon-monoxide dehydrogenase large subunit